jgi:DNA invertase Pin-like site-specific DNA recombinase
VYGTGMSRRTNHSEKVILYCSASADEQAKSKPDVEAQRDRLEAETADRGWTDVQWIEDEGWSPKALKRPGIAEARRQLKAGEAGVLVVARLDRLSRSIIDFSKQLKRAEREGWAIIALDIDLDMTTATGKMMANTVNVIAEWERKTISERTSAALHAKKQAGIELDGRQRTDEETVFDILSWREDKLSLQQIVNKLTGLKYPTARGGRWWPSTVKAVLDRHALDLKAPEEKGDSG